MDTYKNEWINIVDKKKEEINTYIPPNDNKDKYDDFLVGICCIILVVGIILIVLTTEGTI